ncbi:MAG: hypothetical protein OXC71_10715 [Chloroflexi bacterium]|nr:hypothetical protein [Chloroflexota bacterium]
MSERQTDEETSKEAGDGPLLAALRELIRTDGHEEVAELLGVSERTLFRARKEGRLTAGMRNALALHLVAEGGVEAVAADTRGAALKRRMDALEDRVDALAEEMRTGLAAIRGEVRGLRERRSGQGSGDASPVPAHPPTQGEPREVIGQRGRQRPRRPWPELVTAEPEDGEELVYGKATAVITEWREAMTELRGARRRLEQLDAERRVLELEVVLVEEHGLTLPPATYPWNRFERRDEVLRKQRVIANIRRARRLALIPHWLRRLPALSLRRR